MSRLIICTDRRPKTCCTVPYHHHFTWSRITCIARRFFTSRQGWPLNMSYESYEYARSSKQFSCRRVNHLVRLVRTMVIKINVKNRSSLQICCSGLLIHNVERGSVRLMSFVNCQTNQRRRILSWTGRGGDDFQAEVRVLPVQLQRSMHWNRGESLCNQERVSERICLHSVHEKSDARVLMLTTSRYRIWKGKSQNHDFCDMHKTHAYAPISLECRHAAS